MMSDKFSKITLNKEQHQALEVLLTGKNSFLTGEAGTGKTTVISEFLNQTGKNAVVVAPTGVAAVNVGGVTIHSFFQFPGNILRIGELEGIRSAKRREMIAHTDVVIIDEISMVRSDIFSAIDTRLRYFGDRSKPFGGKQLIVTGDFFQLPPFAVTEPEKLYLNAAFGGIFAFQTLSWKQAGFQTLFLKTVHRQISDPLYAKILACIRKNTIAEELILPNSEEPVSVLDALNTAACRRPVSENTVALCTTRNDALAINLSKAAEINAPIHRFSAKISGVFPETFYPTCEVLDLKVGERVMTLANKYEEDLIYCNGDIGVITEIEDDTVTVKFDKGITAKINPFIWSNFEYELVEENGKPRIIQHEAGRFCQMPLRLAYAMTIHKSQGISLDAAHIILGNGCFAPGQLYTALSRLKTLNGLSLDREIQEKDLFYADEVIQFYEEITPAGGRKESEVVSLEIPVACLEQVKVLLHQWEKEQCVGF